MLKEYYQEFMDKLKILDPLASEIIDKYVSEIRKPLYKILK